MDVWVIVGAVASVAILVISSIQLGMYFKDRPKKRKRSKPNRDYSA